jgi:hypothetical protein
MVIAHKTDTAQPSPHGAQYDAILLMLYASYCGGNCP